jgi:hypothetical protein
MLKTKSKNFINPTENFNTITVPASSIERHQEKFVMIKRHRRSRHRHQPSSPVRGVFLTVSVLLILGGVSFVVYSKTSDYIITHRSSPIADIESGVQGYCLDDYRNKMTPNAAVVSWSCNGTVSQQWTVSHSAIRHINNTCLTIQNNGTHSGDSIVIHPCNGEAGQVWVSAIDGYENPTSALCLSLPSAQTGVQLVAASCQDLTEPDEAWMPSVWSIGSANSAASRSCSGTEGQLVACYAAKQWVTWQSGSPSHVTLLNNYSEGNGYEEWCADFVSYVYREAGYPFTQGERSGWDEYLASNIENMGVFTYHSAASGYIPQAGDVAFFDYPGGHVEIVAVGGSKPIFIYGDSGTNDPTTNNGEMAENTITNDGNEGQVIYYLSPSSE